MFEKNFSSTRSSRFLTGKLSSWLPEKLDCCDLYVPIILMFEARIVIRRTIPTTPKRPFWMCLVQDR